MKILDDCFLGDRYVLKDGRLAVCIGKFSNDYCLKYPICMHIYGERPDCITLYDKDGKSECIEASDIVSKCTLAPVLAYIKEGDKALLENGNKCICVGRFYDGDTNMCKYPIGFHIYGESPYLIRYYNENGEPRDTECLNICQRYYEDTLI